MSQEIELKLALPSRAVPALRRHPLFATASRLGNAVTLDNTYFDTPELHLKSRKVSLRTRKAGRILLQTVKCGAVSSGGLTKRPEWEQPFTGEFDFSAIDAADVATLLNRQHAGLVPVFTTRFRRETRRYQPREGLSILMMIDTGTVSCTDANGVERSAPICELELELEEGRPADLFVVASELAQTLPLMPADLSKAERGYNLFLDLPLQVVRAEVSNIRADDMVIDAFRKLAFSCVRQWQGNASAALAEDDPHLMNPDFIHQLRVAQRRLRALIKLFAPALPPDFAGGWNARLRENANRFGDARDLDVFHTELLKPVTPDELADLATMSKLNSTVGKARETARKHAVRNLDMATQGRLLLDFCAALMELPVSSLTEAADLRTFARLRMDRLRKRARRQYEAATTLEPTRLHTLRIGFKQLRYGIEFFEPLFPSKQVDRYLEGLVRAQTTLGFLQDVDIARMRLEEWRRGDPGLASAVAFVLGWHGPRYARLRRRVLHDCEPLLWGKTPW